MRHGLSKTNLYSRYTRMVRRCENRNSPDYALYGGRGIKVCQEWRRFFTKFYEWALANGYSDDLSIDRIDPNGDYEPSNCRWVSISENSRWKRTTRLDEEKAKTIRRMHAAGESQLAIAEQFGITRRHVNGICRDQAWVSK